MEMNFNDFLQNMIADMQLAHPELRIEQREVDKLQGQSYTGISVYGEDERVGATLNMEPYYKALRNGEDYLEVAKQVNEQLKRAVDQMPDFSIAELSDYEVMKTKLTVEMVNTEENKEMLQNMPHEEIEDMSVVYRFQLSKNEDGYSSVLVTNEMMQNYGINAELLKMDAAIYAPDNAGMTIRSMSDVLKDLSGGVFDLPPEAETPMWVASVEGNFHGAAVLTYPDFFEVAIGIMGGNDFFILPSSTHELLLLPDDGNVSARGLNEMVRSINATEVAPEDRLSDNAFHYDVTEHKFEKAVDYENRILGVQETTMITALLVEPNKFPKEITIDNNLEALQQAVGGLIEIHYPKEEGALIIMNEEGKLNMEANPLNRAILGEDGEMVDIIAGSFLVVGDDGENFTSLTPDQIKHFEERFHSPEAFIKMGQSMMSIPIPDEMVEKAGHQNAEKDHDKKHHDKKHHERKSSHDDR